MRSVPHVPTLLPVRLLALGGITGLAALTFAFPGATRMWSTPWTLVLAATLLVPLLAFVSRCLFDQRPLHLPSRGWLWVASGSGFVALASALASPYRAPSLLLAGFPVGAAMLFLAIHDWLALDPAPRRARLEQFFTAAAAAVVVVSTVSWMRSILTLPTGELISASLFERRNPFPLGHANYTAGLMLLALPWLVVAAYRGRGAYRATAAGGVILGLLNLFMSGSRGGLLGLAVLGVAGLAAAGLSRKRLALSGLGVLAVAVLLAAINPRIRHLWQPADPAAAPNSSSVQRLAMLDAGWRMGRDRPLLGWGPGTTPLAYPRYRALLAGGTENVLQLHNTPVQLWAETGAAGLLVALGLAVLVARHWRREPVAAVTLAGYGIFSLTDYQLDVPIFAAALAAFAALLSAGEAAPVMSRARSIVVSLAVAAVAVIALAGERDPAPALNTEALALARDPAQHDRAVALLQQSLSFNPDQEIAHFNLGWLLLVSDPVAAEKHFRAAAHLVPDKGGVYFGLGLARRNQGDHVAATWAFALECTNDPLFLASPWWTVPAIAAERDTTTRRFIRLLERIRATPDLPRWVTHQAELLATLAPRLGRVSPAPELHYRRERIGYPVLMRNSDLPVPVDLYDVREDPGFPASVPFALPSKGWLPSPQLLKLLDDPAS